MVLEQPILTLGLAGFSPAQEARLIALLRSQPAVFPVWTLCAFDEADAWWVNGANVQRMADGCLLVPSRREAGPPLQLALERADRPIAFATPLAQAIAGECGAAAGSFDPACPASVLAMLQHFESRLRPLRAQFCLGAELCERQASLQSAVYHVTRHAALLAVVDIPRGQVGYLAGARLVDLQQARWDKRPPSARDIPAPFARASVPQVLWNYVQRSARALLPARYRSGTIYFRRLPPLPPGLLHDSQRRILQQLAAAPSSFDALLLQAGMDEARLARDLACLFVAGAITSTRSQAAVREARGGMDALARQVGATGWGDTLSPGLRRWPDGPLRPMPGWRSAEVPHAQ